MTLNISSNFRILLFVLALNTLSASAATFCGKVTGIIIDKPGVVSIKLLNVQTTYTVDVRSDHRENHPKIQMAIAAMSNGFFFCANPNPQSDEASIYPALPRPK